MSNRKLAKADAFVFIAEIEESGTLFRSVNRWCDYCAIEFKQNPDGTWDARVFASDSSQGAYISFSGLPSSKALDLEHWFITSQRERNRHA